MLKWALVIPATSQLALSELILAVVAGCRLASSSLVGVVRGVKVAPTLTEVTYRRECP